MSKLDVIKEKKCNTMKEKYGVMYPLQSQEIRERTYNTWEKKYGTRNIAELNSVKEKRENTLSRIYGFRNVMQCLNFKNRAKQTNLLRYGYMNPVQSPEIRKKISESLAKNQTVATSKQQKYLHQLYGGELNGVVSHYNCDIVFREEKQILEYDGGGHFLGVKIGIDSTEESKQKELIRDKQIKSEGFRIMRIISRKDYLPSDTTLLQMLQYARDFFVSNPDRSWISFDIDNNCIYNAYHKESTSGLPYDYGKLRKIKKEHLSSRSSPPPSLNSITV